jgi:carboxyl-terminal processing protease
VKYAVASCRKWIALPLCLLLTLVAWAQVADQSVEPQLDPDHEIAQLRESGLRLAVRGDFESGLADLRKAAGMGDSKTNEVRTAIELLEAHINRMEQAKQQRKQELQYEIDRMYWGFLAQEYREELDAQDFGEDLRSSINDDLAEAYQDIGTSETFEDSSPEAAAEMKSTSLDAIDKARQAVRHAMSLLAEMDNEYAKTFKVEAETLIQRLDEAETVWQGVDGSTPQSRWQGALEIMAAEEQLADAVTDLEVMVAKKPWKIALLHGRLAFKIADDEKEARLSEWYGDLIDAAEAHGEQSIAEAEWYDALNAYITLEELEPANETYRDELQKVRRHVRVLRLYSNDNGEEEDKNADDDEDDADDESVAKEDESQTDQEPEWKEFVEGVDAKMIRTAISKLDGTYVAAVNYRDLTLGALESIRILAETPQVRETFPGLDDDAKRTAFIEAIEQEKQAICEKDRIDHVDLLMALNRMTYSSSETVKLPLEVLVVEFADGFLDELDEFSGMIWPSDVIDFNKSTMGNFTGIGVQITKETKEPLKVVTPLLGTPAFKAGIKAGDLILKVDGTATRNHTVDELVDRIMGPRGTKVILTIKRRGVAKPFDVPVIRDKVHLRTVKGWQRRDDGEWSYVLPDEKTGYIRLTQFTDQTHETVRAALDELHAKGITSVVLDLRANPGGLLRSATAVANEFLDAGRIVFTKGRQVPRREVDANNDGNFLTGDMVVLIDQHSASAAEILSGALKDWGRATIVGHRSYGKGSVQNVIPVHGDNAYLKLTTQYYYLPKGRLLHRKPGATDWGVDPDVEVTLTPNQMRRWVILQRKTDLLQDFVPELLQADLERLYVSDIQLNAAVLLLRMMDLQRTADAEEHIATEAASAAR